jgi:DNA (cytosine-5)-methyltransferase 1
MKRVKTKRSTKTMTCVDLFAGAGGFSLAAKQAGLDVIAAIERDAHACNTYRANLVKRRRKTVLYEDDIFSISPKEFAAKHFPKASTCDLLLGGPPCQGFSTHRIKGAGVDDPRNRLVLRYFQFIAALKPKMFLMENVPGILWPRHKKFLDSLYRGAKRAGFQLFAPAVIDARDFGVPQRRKRVFILGIRNDYKLAADWPPPSTHCPPEQIDEDSPLRAWVPASVVFKPDPPPDDLNDVHMQHTSELIKVFKATPKNGGSRGDSGRTLPCHADHDGHKDVYGRIDPKVPGPTMTTACVNPSKGRFVHPTRNHGITVRQAARFQTFPDTYKFAGGLTAAAMQIGNAVPVLLGKVLIEFLAKSLRKRLKAKRQTGRRVLAPKTLARLEELNPAPQRVRA